MPELLAAIAAAAARVATAAPEVLPHALAFLEALASGDRHAAQREASEALFKAERAAAVQARDAAHEAARKVSGR